MKVFAKRASVALFSAVVLTAASGAAMASTVVHVSLWDKGADMQMVTGEEYAPGVKIDTSKATMGVKAMPDQAKAGVVTFKVTNNSKDTIHEMIVMQLDKAGDPLPYHRRREPRQRGQGRRQGRGFRARSRQVRLADGRSAARQVSAHLQRARALRLGHVDRIHRRQITDGDDESAGGAAFLRRRQPALLAGGRLQSRRPSTT